MCKTLVLNLPFFLKTIDIFCFQRNFLFLKLKAGFFIRKKNPFSNIMADQTIKVELSPFTDKDEILNLFFILDFFRTSKATILHKLL